MLERAVQFGVRALLSGIVTEPEAQRAREGAPILLMINSGILHKVGSCRLHVQIARALAEEGIASLRFDLSGLGDSDVRRDALPFEESSVLETREAMDYLERTKGATRFLLAGLCSGSDVAHMTALADDRVIGMGSIDARSHETFGYWRRHYASRVLSAAAWRRWLKARFGGGAATSGDIGTADAGPDQQSFEVPMYVRIMPPRDTLAAELRQLVSRDLRLLYVFTDGLDYYNHEGQHRSAFHDVPFGGRMRECHLRGADHIVTDLAMQRRVVDLHVQWALAAAEECRAAAGQSIRALAAVP